VSAVAKTIDISVQPLGLKARGECGQTLRKILQELGVELSSTCNGLGRCGKCRVVVSRVQTAVGEPTAAEREHISAQELLAGFRLACQARAQGNVEVCVPKDSMIWRTRLQTEGVETSVEPLPLVKKLYVELSKPTLRSLEPDLERLMRKICEHNVRPSYLPPQILEDLPETLRIANWKVTATVWGCKEILDVEEGNTTKASYGFSFDVGTTKIAAYLLNLSTAETVAISSMVNPQVKYGDDVISRIAHAVRGETERKELQLEALEGINQLAAECCSKHGIDPRHIYEATVVGNTAMHHLLLHICPKHLALSPYVPAVKRALNLKAHQLNLRINPHANIHFLPVIAGFVGSDCVADILATSIFQEEDPCLLLDIGTNTEVVVGNKKRMLACSCASGPAFEGAHVRHGMKASSGAIESAEVDTETLEVRFRTIDNAEPRGLCGSGVVDIVAEMLKAKIVDSEGAIRHDANSSRIRVNDHGQLEFVIVQEGKTGPRDIVVTQRDIREIQLAKAAIRTGISILMQEIDIRLDQIAHMYIAGAFGTYIDPASARLIGMIPYVPLSIIMSVGNAAGMGARMALMSSKARSMCEKISHNVEYVELAAHSDFRSTFMESLRFPYR